MTYSKLDLTILVNAFEFHLHKSNKIKSTNNRTKRKVTQNLKDRILIDKAMQRRTLPNDHATQSSSEQLRDEKHNTTVVNISKKKFEKTNVEILNKDTHSSV